MKKESNFGKGIAPISKARQKVLKAVIQNINPMQESGEAKFEFTMRDALVLQLTTQVEWDERLPMGTRIEASEMAEYLVKNIESIKFLEFTAENIRDGKFKIIYTPYNDAKEVFSQMEKYFDGDAIKFVVRLMVAPLFDKSTADEPSEGKKGKKRTKGLDPKKVLSGQFPVSATISNANTQTLRPESKVQIVGDNFLDSVESFKMENYLLALLMETSNKDPKSPDYFTGNMKTEPLQVTGLTLGTDPEPVIIPFERAAMKIKLGDIFRVWSRNEKLGANGKKSVLKILKNYNQASLNLALLMSAADGRQCRLLTNDRRIQLFFIVYENNEARQIDDIDGCDSEQEIIVTFSPAFLLFRGVSKDGKNSEPHTNTPSNVNHLLEAAAGGAKNLTIAHCRMYQYLNGLRYTGATRLRLSAAIEKAGLQTYFKSRNAQKGRAILSRALDDISKMGLMSYTVNDRGGEPVFEFTFKKGGM